MITRALIMRPDKPHETVEVELRPGKDLHGDLHRFLDPILGGDLEHVRVFADFAGGHKWKYLDMFVNETGALDGLPRNGAATTIYRRNALFHEPGKFMAEELSAIYGPAVLFEQQVWK